MIIEMTEVWIFTCPLTSVNFLVRFGSLETSRKLVSEHKNVYSFDLWRFKVSFFYLLIGLDTWNFRCMISVFERSLLLKIERQILVYWVISPFWAFFIEWKIHMNRYSLRLVKLDDLTKLKRLVKFGWMVKLGRLQTSFHFRPAVL